MSDNKIISVKNLFSIYNENEDNQYVALTNVNYDFYENKIYCIIGNSGSGKSTLVTHFNGLINTKYGTIDIFPEFNKISKSLESLLIGKLDENTSRILGFDENEYLFIFNTNKISKKLAKILIESYCRSNILSIEENSQLSKLFSLSINESFWNSFCLEFNSLVVDNIDQNNLKIENLINTINLEHNKVDFNKVCFKVKFDSNYSFLNVNSIKLELLNSYKEFLKIDKTLKQLILKLELIKLGFNWNLQKLLYGHLNQEESKKIINNINELVFFFNSKKVPKKIAKLLIEGYYKLKVDKIRKVNDLFLLTQYNIKNKSAFIVSTNLDSNIKITDNVYIKDIQNDKSLNNINIPNYFQKRKIKKIKKFKQLRREIGMVFQFPEYQLFKDTIEKDIMFGPIALGIKKDEAKRRAKYYLNKLGMSDEFLPRNPFGLSGGQKRRVAIAGILAIETGVLIFDEPTAGLDPVGEQETMEMILNHKKEGKTVFVITHTMDHVLEIADEVIVLNDGEIIKYGDPYSIFLDDEIINFTSIDTPKVIKTIKELIQKDNYFKKLIDYKPRTIEQLTDAIVEIVTKKG